MTQSNLEIIRGMYDAWNRRDLDGFLGVLAPDVEWRFADSFIYGEINPLIGVDAVRDGSLKQIREDWDDFEGELGELLDAGDTIIGLGWYVGVHKQTGRPLRAQFAHIYDLQDGKVTRWRQYVDTRQFAKVAGVDP
jgi:ketosteroid isomerase-like protein